MSGNVPSPSRWQTVAGAVCITAAAVWVAMTLPAPAHPLGSDWGHHFTVAEFIWHPDPDIGYPLFRRPWYGWLLGALGEGMGYLEAAQFIGRCSAVLIVLSAGLGAWALAGPLAGSVAALVGAWMPLVREGGLWVNHYPLLGAACGLALAAGAAGSRWPRAHWVFLAGLSGGAAAAIDVRGEAVLLCVVLLVMLSALWDRQWRVMGINGLILIMGAALVPAHASWLDTAFEVPEIEFEEQVRVQRRGVLGQIQGGTFQDPVLENSCVGIEAGEMDLKGLRAPCAGALRTNALRRLEAGGTTPPGGVLALVVLALLPVGSGRRERARSFGAAGIVFGLPLVALWVGMGWVTYFPRYVLPFAAVIAMLVPVALYRVLAVWGRGTRLVGPAGALCALACAVLAWPGLPQPLAAAKTEGAGADRAAGHFAGWVSTHLGEGDFMVDCAGLAVDSLLLPQQIDYLRFPPGDVACTAHIRNPMTRRGTTYLVTMHRDLPEHLVEDAHSPQAIAGYGWVPVQTDAPTGYRLWRHGAEE